MSPSHVCLVLAVVAGAAGAARAEELDAQTTIAAPVSYRNLTVFPLVAKAPAGAAEYDVLDDGLKSGRVKVVEKGEGEVNQLTLRNNGKRPLFVMSGEVVLGGKQDRIIGKDQIIGAGETVDVPVYCVEHGRWAAGASGHGFAAGGSLADSQVRKKAAFKDSQSEVWDKVAEKNAKRGIANATGTYRQVATGDKVAADVKPYAEHLDPALAAPATVGVAVALNGRVVGIEQFASPGLFAKLRVKLLRSYVVNALDEPEVASAPAATAADVRAFAARTAAAKSTVVLSRKAAQTTRQEGKGVVGAEVRAVDAPAAAPPVYKTVQTDE
jgi:hypothetical protein